MVTVYSQGPRRMKLLMLSQFAAPGGSTAVDIAVIVKLTRVAMLVPVAILIGLWFGKSEGSKEKDRGVIFRFRGSFSDF